MLIYRVNVSSYYDSQDNNQIANIVHNNDSNIVVILTWFVLIIREIIDTLKNWSLPLLKVSNRQIFPTKKLYIEVVDLVEIG